jgi:hypothetical protein
METIPNKQVKIEPNKDDVPRTTPNKIIIWKNHYSLERVDDERKQKQGKNLEGVVGCWKADGTARDS